MITELEALRSQLPVPRNHHRFHDSLAQFVIAPRKRRRHIVKLLDARAHRPKYEQQRLRIRILALFRHIDIRGLNSVQPREFEELCSQAAGSCAWISHRIPAFGISGVII